MDKQKFKSIKSKLKEQEKQDFLASLPMEETLFVKLFHFLDEKLQKQACKHTPQNAFAFLAKHKVKKPYQVIDWLADNGGHCDCEILYNVTELFDHLDNTWEEPVEIPTEFEQILKKKQKINTLHTDFGFAIDVVPLPWKMSQSLESKDSQYYFQIGKGMNVCLANLKAHFPKNQWADDDFFLQDYKNYTLERLEVLDYDLVVLCSKTNTRVKIWCKPKLHDWYLEIATEFQRRKGDLKELEKLLKAIK